MLNRNYSYMIQLYSSLHAGNAVGSLVGNILTVQCHVKQQFIILYQLTVCGISAGQRNLKKGVLAEENLHIGARFRSKVEEVVF